MAQSARIFATIPTPQFDHLSRLAEAHQTTIPQLVARLLGAMLERQSAAQAQGTHESPADGALLTATEPPVGKYTIRLGNQDARLLEQRAKQRGLRPSTYLAHVVLAHLRPAPPMPYQEFERVKQIVNELSGIRRLLMQVVASPEKDRLAEPTTSSAIMKLLPALKTIRDDVQAHLVANSKSWEAPDA